ncbi:MAG: EF-hand domain-containing protein [Luteolibacter sp.]
MKTITLSFLLSAGLFTAAHAQSAGENKPPREDEGKPAADHPRPPKPKPDLDKIWKSLDTNTDGFVSPEEFSTLPRIAKLPEEKRGEIFKRFDKDGDGKLTRDELEAMFRRFEGNKMQRLKELDTDKSGGISFEEFKAGEMFKKLPPEKQEAIFKRLDSDGDGQITPKDRPRRDRERPSPKHIFEKNDENRDGFLSFEEFRKDPMVAKRSEDEQEDLFLKLDEDKDRKLSFEEMRKMFPPPPDRKKDEPKPEKKFAPAPKPE